MTNHTSTPADFDPDFDSVYRIDRAGVIAAMPGEYAPDVQHDPSDDVYVSAGWSVLTGHTGQYGYNGAVMHPSEQWGTWATDELARIADDDSSAGVAFTIVEVRDEDGGYPDGDPIGWAVAYRTIATH